MTLFQNYSTIYSYNDFCDGATHLGENESELKIFKIFRGKLKFFVDLDFFAAGDRRTGDDVEVYLAPQKAA